jgi:hypothetical protein
VRHPPPSGFKKVNLKKNWEIYQLNFMELSPSLEASGYATTQEFPKTFDGIRMFIAVLTKSPTLVPILSQTNPVCTTPSYFTLRSILMLLCHLRSPCEFNRASPIGGRRPLSFKRDLMGLSLSSTCVCSFLSLSFRLSHQSPKFIPEEIHKILKLFCKKKKFLS